MTYIPYGIVKLSGASVILVNDKKEALKKWISNLKVADVQIEKQNIENFEKRTVIDSISALIELKKPSLVFLDNFLPEKDTGVGIVNKLASENKTFHIIIWSMERPEANYIQRAKENILVRQYVGDSAEVHEKIRNGLTALEGLDQIEINRIRDCFEPTYRDIISSISVLKHRIAHLFLSMDVDLQGIGVLRKQVAKGVIQNAANTPEAYLQDVLNSKEKTDYYRQKFADLQFLVAKVSGGKKKPFLECDAETSGGLVRPTLLESNLPEDKLIVDLIPEEKRNDDSVVRLWSTLVDLSGLKLKDANKRFQNINPDTNSRIFKFMCLMDCEIDKKDNIREEDVNDVMDFFAKIEGGKGWAVDGANVSPISSFHDWFCALVDCLEKLRNEIKSD